MRIRRINIVILFALAGISHNGSAQVRGGLSGQFFVAPTGSPGGDGSISNPWDFATALSHPPAVNPGDTIWLRAGTYGTGGSTMFTSNLLGTSAEPIIVRQLPNERAIVDGAINVTGGYTWYWGFEITNSSTIRKGDPSVRAPGLLLGNNVGGNKAINLVIHDTGHPAVQFNNQSDQGEVYGCILWGAGIYDTTMNGGTTPVTRGDGVYAQNDTGRTYITDNITFWNFTVGTKAYGEGGAVKGFDVRGNVSFENGDRGMFFATNSGDPTNVVEGLVVSDNAVYQTKYGRKTLQIGYKGVNKDAVVTGNYLVGADSGTTAAFFVNQFKSVSILRNTSVGAIDGKGSIVEIQPATGGTVAWDQNNYFGGWSTPFYYFAPSQGVDRYFDFAGWKTKTKFDASSKYSTALPTGVKVVVRPNKYEPNRANIAIINWSNLAAVPVDVSGAIAVGAQFDLYDVENLFGAPVVSGTYDGSPIVVPMNLTTVTPLVGTITHMPNITHTAPRFASFVLIPKLPISSVSAPAISPNGGSFTGPVTVTLGTSTSGATILYTTDGSTPTASSAEYSAPFVITTDTVVKAVAVKGAGHSAIATASFTVNSTDKTPPVITAVSAGSITLSSAAISWTTNEKADSQVEYGLTTSYGITSPLNANQTTIHIVALGGLSANTLYNYRVRSRDASGNLAVSPNLTFRTTRDLASPVMSSVTAVTTESTVTVTWSTDENSTSELQYGTTSSLGQTTGVAVPLVRSHSMSVRGLAPGTTYYYRVLSKDGSGNQSASVIATVKTGDTIPPIVSGVSVVSSANSAAIHFTTNEGAWCKIDYGTTIGYGESTAFNSTSSTTFSIMLPGLASRTLYHFQIHCEDALENGMNTSDRSFSTI